ncbi:hypothetical protein LSUE1_G000160 [Lachnellula suecica]|uniref:Restriction of telomere capping protein 4 n=1 Tax=Lachnellula suecica TaxID=602035 RepID=A0A8T9CSD2_9HELO|nr:hypothetical protein LSUE1_G000160 [Lachnellula suecica]
MPAPTAKRSNDVKLEKEDDINRRPESSSEDEDRGAIKPTVFKRASQEAAAGASKTKPKPGKRGKKGETVNGNNGTNKGTRKSTRTEIVSTQDSGSSSPKRKSQEEPPVGSGMADEFGRVKSKKARKTFGSSQNQPSSSGGGYGKNAKKDADFRKVPTIPGSPEPASENTTFKVHNSLDFDSPAPSPRKPFNQTGTPSPLKDKASPTSKFRAPIGFDDSGDELSGSHQEKSSPVPTNKSRKKDRMEDLPLTQGPSFKMPQGFDELAGTVEELLGEDREKLNSVTAADDDDDDDMFASLTQRARCPMCNKPVDPADLRDFGNMNTRRQGEFCQWHQKKTAQDDWDLKGFPEIDWDKLRSRITKHRVFIKKVINGGDSHYRDLLEDRVNAGKDRNLLKMTSNLTPGYYGGRGLRIMSENIMHEFTALLKKKAVKDRRISSRGPTAFVQSVLVPEVTVLLIMEDMNVEVEEARNILEESAGVGELIHEEIRDVVKKRIEDSEDEDDFDD